MFAAIRLIFSSSPYGVRIEVDDASSGRPQQREPGADDCDGRGLLLVDALSDRWGVSARPGIGKRVWSELTGTRAERESGRHHVD
ncbi:ATP-binding protein [Streptomyces sp. AK02-01A]|uniref:ATP-binding protein n=1 Tax=Streptomyces sp. AK02-01A TaxID=3028648 RepID=UPI0029AC530E|nr:ATP-binding protein [Streptomyces sp. AK02-01A]MDX3855388.1 ATP-binding protein [Streptomyces sp. AK02-01A]